MAVPQGCVRAGWVPVERLDLRRFKEAVVLYGIHSPFVQQMLNSWSTGNRIVPNDWKDLVTIVYWNLVHSYSGGYGKKLRLGPLNNKVG